MNEIPVLDNPLVWVHMRLSSPRNTLIALGVYILIIMVLVSLTLAGNPGRGLAGAADGWTYGLLFFQAIVLLVFGAQRVGGAIRRDLTSHMMESHRLMPISAFRAVFGYLMGGASQTLLFGFTNVVIGAIIASLGSIGAERWLFANLVLIYFAIFWWTIVTMFAFISRHIVLLMIAPIFIGIFSRRLALYMLPGLWLSTSPLVGGTLFDLTSASYAITPYLLLSVAAEVGFGALFFWGAVRKYQQPDQPAFVPLQGILLLMGFVFLSLIGMVGWEDIASGMIRREISSDTTEVQFYSSLILALLLATIPIASTARAWAVWRQEKLAHNLAIKKRPLPPLWTPVLASLICMFIMLCAPRITDLSLSKVIQIAVVVVSFLFSVHYVLRIFYRASLARGNVLAGIWVMVTWLIPLGLDWFRYGVVAKGEGETITLLGYISPPATLVGILSVPKAQVLPGLILQVFAATCMCVLYYRTGKSRSASRLEWVADKVNV